jgi:hypothetical protein
LQENGGKRACKSWEEECSTSKNPALGKELLAMLEELSPTQEVRFAAKAMKSAVPDRISRTDVIV